MLKLRECARLIDDENGTFLLDTRRGVYWHLNVMGMDVVQALAQERTVEEITSGIVTRFDVDAQTARLDVDNLIRSLKRAKLIEGRV